MQISYPLILEALFKKRIKINTQIYFEAKAFMLCILDPRIIKYTNIQCNN